MLRFASSFLFTLLLPLGAVGCMASSEQSAQESLEAQASFDSSEDALTSGELACTVSQVAGGAAIVGSVVCWIPAVATQGISAPACLWLASAGVTALKVTNGAVQCATGCALAGKVCRTLAESWGGQVPTSARITNVGCNGRGDFVAEADVCGLGLNRIYPRGTPEARACVPGKPTGFLALSTAQRAYLRDRRNCAARGFR